MAAQRALRHRLPACVLVLFDVPPAACCAHAANALRGDCRARLRETAGTLQLKVAKGLALADLLQEIHSYVMAVREARDGP